MKKIKALLAVFVFVSLQITMNAQEKKIKFNKGTLKICSSRNFQISGYDGDEVIIKSLHKNTWGSYYYKNLASKDVRKAYLQGQKFGKKLKEEESKLSKNSRVTISSGFTTKKGNDSGIFLLLDGDHKRKKGLKKLGKKNENLELGIHFIIEEKDGELIFRDDNKNNSFVMHGDESYEVQIPNSIKLDWQAGQCEKPKKDREKIVGRTIFYNSKASLLSDFNGEVEISTSLSNMKLYDITGPVSINSIGGNVTIEFDKKRPSKLYSIYSNNGFIDITLPENSNIGIDAKGKSIYSDIDFKILNEVETDISQEMKLKLNSGKVKMKLDAGHGNIYLRKK